MDLRTALLLIGLVFIAVVVVTATRRRRPVPAKRHNPESRDEPSLHVPKQFHPELDQDSPLSDADDQLARPDNRPEILEDRDIFDINTHRHDIHIERSEQLDEQLDHVAYINGGSPAAWSELKKNIFPIIAYTAEPIQFFGQSSFGNTWYVVQKHGEIDRFGNLALALPLLDKNNNPAAFDFNQLDAVAETIAELLGRHVKLPNATDTPKVRAEQLATFYRDYKFMLYVHILAKPGSLFEGKDLSRIFARENLQYQDGFYHKFSSANHKEILFSVADLYQPGTLDNRKLKRHQTAGLTLFISIPMVKRPSRVFIDMLKMADELATGLGGQMHDPDFNEVSVDMLEATSEELMQMEDAMRSFGIPAGSSAAQHLFAR